MSTAYTIHPSSYRDPSGFIFQKGAAVYRQVNQSFKEDFNRFTGSGCYQKLVEQELLIPHRIIPENLTGDPRWYTTLEPEKIPFWSYPWEWSFDMLKEAALLTLRLARESIPYGCMLKDATPYNIQWYKGKMIFIDTLSFEKYKPEEPWVAYRQFCEQFLSPLLLMHYSKLPLQQLLLAWPEGIPLAITRNLLPWRSRFSLHTWLHIHLHAAVASRKRAAGKKVSFTMQKFQNLIRSLELLVNKLRLPAQSTAWSGYYEEAGQRDDYLVQKKNSIGRWLDQLTGVRSVIDLGANDGTFSKMAAERNLFTVAADADPVCINNLYKATRAASRSLIHPLIIDLANPSPATGVDNKERSAFSTRAKADLCLALALVHHLAIGKNIPLSNIAGLFQAISPRLIIEFVPKEDEKVKQLLQHKKDIYDNYDSLHFEEAFQQYYTITEKTMIPGSGRTLYLLQQHEK